MKNQLKTTKPKDRKDRRHINWGRFLFAGFLSVTMLAANTMPAFAATTVWEKANEIMKDVYMAEPIAAVICSLPMPRELRFFCRSCSLKR